MTRRLVVEDIALSLDASTGLGRCSLGARNWTNTVAIKPAIVIINLELTRRCRFELELLHHRSAGHNVENLSSERVNKQKRLGRDVFPASRSGRAILRGTS